MTEAKSQEKSIPSPPQRRSVWEILGRSMQLYWAHVLPFSRVLAWPVGQMLLGAYASQVLIFWLLQQNQALAMESPGLAVALAVGITLACVSLIVRGAWQFMVYWASLSLNAWEAETNQPLKFKEAYQNLGQEKQLAYSILAGTYFSLPALTLLPVILLSLLGVFLGPHMLELLFLAGSLMTLILGLLWVFSLIPLSFVFQIAAFENGLPLNPVHTLLLSCKLCLKQCWKTLFLQVAVFLLSNVIIPQPLVWLARLAGLSGPLDKLHQWLLAQSGLNLEATLSSVPLANSLLGPHLSWTQLMAQSMTDLTLCCTLTLMLLPLGTFVFTLLYKDILKCDRSKKTWLGI